MTIKNFSMVFVSLLVLSLVLWGCSGPGEKVKTSKSVVEMEQWSKDLLAAWTSHDVEKTLSFYTDDCIFEDLFTPKVTNGKEELRAYIKEFLTGMPDFRIEMKSFFASDDHVCIEWIMSGTHSGNLPGMPATGKSYSVPGVAVIELKEGKAKRETDYFESATFLRQLGLLPATPQK